MKRTLLAALALLGTLTLCPAQDKKPAATPAAIPNPAETPSAKGTRVYIIGLKDGKPVKGPVTIRFGVRGMGVCPAGLYLPRDGRGAGDGRRGEPGAHGENARYCLEI